MKSTKPTVISLAVFFKSESSIKAFAGKVTTKLPLLSAKFDNVNVYSTPFPFAKFVGPSNVLVTFTSVPSIFVTILYVPLFNVVWFNLASLKYLSVPLNLITTFPSLSFAPLLIVISDAGTSLHSGSTTSTIVPSELSVSPITNDFTFE